MTTNRRFTDFILDVDGVLTDGGFYYSVVGKVLKSFGPDDHDALKLLSSKIRIQFVTSDRRGYRISRRRITKDMGFQLSFVPADRRLDWIKQSFEIQNVVYMGDSFADIPILRAAGYGIAPANSFHEVAKFADFVTHHSGGDRAVAEACLKVGDILGFNLRE